MKTPSFRLRLALWSALLAGLTLLGFSAAVIWQIRLDKISAIDRELRLYTGREASHPSHPQDYWQHIEEMLNELLQRNQNKVVVLVVQANNGLNYQSLTWPTAIPPANLPWPQSPSPFNNWPPQFPPAIPLPMPPKRPPVGAPPPVLITQLATETKVWRIGLAASPFMRLAIGVNLAVVDAEMTAMWQAFLWAIPVALLLIGIGAAILSSRALKPVQNLTATMQKITVKGLNQRIATGKEYQEFSQLIQVFNDMLERLERSFLQASRFSADAAHELKTPLAIVQGQIEQMMSQVETGSQIQIRLSGILDEIQRLSSISRKLLLLSLADAGRLRLHKVHFNLSQALTDLVEDAQMLAPQLQISGTIEANLLIEADADLIRQVFHNLISNAIKYNMPDEKTGLGWIQIHAYRQKDRIEVTIANSSLGISETEQLQIFKRFYRADLARNRNIEGVGLGLSLAREIVLAHGGQLRLATANIGKVMLTLDFSKTYTVKE